MGALQIQRFLLPTPFVPAGAGSAAHYVNWPSPQADGDFERFVVRAVVPELRRALQEAGALKVMKGVEETAQFMISLRDDLVTMLKDGFEPPTRDPRILMAAAAFAFYQDPSAYAAREVEDMILFRIALDADNAPRAAETIAAAAPESDREAGARLAALLGRAAAR